MVSLVSRAVDLFGGGALKSTLSSFCTVETSYGDKSLVADDGSMATIFRLDGFRSLPGEKDVTQACDQLRVGLSPFFSSHGVAVQFWFGQSPELGKREIDNLIKETARVAHDNGLELDDLLDERRNLLPERVFGERCYMAVWSRPSLLTNEDRKASEAKRTKTLATAPPMSLSQIPDVALDGLTIRHVSLIEGFEREFSQAGIVISPLEVHDALDAVRKVIAPDAMGANGEWRAVLPTDHIRARLPTLERNFKKGDISNLGWPRLDSQLFTDNAEVIDNRVVQIGNTVFSGFDISLPPELVVPFNDLIKRVIENGTKLSWRCSFLVESGGFAGQYMKDTLAFFLRVTNKTHNSRIHDAFDRLKKTDGDGNTVVRWRASFAAWAPADQITELRSNVSALQEMARSWGNCQTNSLVGDPLACVMSSSLGLSTTSTAESASGDLFDVLAMAPIVRPACPWKKGTVLLRTPDGKTFPYQPGSSLQNATVNIMVGTPGSGKSVLMNTLNLGMILSPQTGSNLDGTSVLPRISIIDIGPSSSGLISLIRDALPQGRKHEAVFHRLKMEERYAVNPFDTQLGCRQPFSHERGFLVNFLSLLCTPDDRDAPYDGISDLADACVEEAYRQFGDGETPKRYSQGQDAAVDEALAAHSFETDDATSWWEVVDFLFDKKDYHGAALAQRLAVPVLGDLIQCARSETVRAPFTEMKVQSTGEHIIDSFIRQITASIKQYIILSSPTRFDVANARVISFDLASVTGSPGARGRKQTAVMYMMARQALTTDFWLDDVEIKDLKLPANVTKYHLKRFQNNRQMPKLCAYDEWHLTGGLAIQNQVAADIRVGRKANLHIMLASQLIDDFDDTIRQLATNIFLCNVPTAESIKTVMETYALPKTLRPVISRLTGPDAKNGAPVVGIFKLKDQTYIQHVYNQLGPIELWALSTTSEDATLRTFLYERVGSVSARRILARRFPRGSAKPEIESRLEALVSEGRAKSDEETTNIIEELANELVRGAYQ